MSEMGGPRSISLGYVALNFFLPPHPHLSTQLIPRPPSPTLLVSPLCLRLLYSAAVDSIYFTCGMQFTFLAIFLILVLSKENKHTTSTAVEGSKKKKAMHG
jgi:hypothetical protein